MLPGFQVIAVGHRFGQVLGDVFNGGQGDGFAENIDPLAHHHFGVVEQSVKSLIGGVLGGNGLHQFRVHNGQHRHQAGVAPKADFFVGVQLADNTPVIDFRAGSGGEGDGDDGQGVVGQGLGLAGAAYHIVPQISGVGGHSRHRHRGVQHSAAPQGHNEVTALFLRHTGGFHHQVLGGVFLDDGAGDVFHPCLFQLLLGFIQCAGHLGRFSGGKQQQRLFAGHGLAAQLLQAAGAEEQVGGGI